MIEVYTQPNCPACDATKMWLNRRGVPYVEHNAENYRDFLTLRLHAKQAPLIVIYTASGAYDRHWSGHQTRQLETLTNTTAGTDDLWEED